MTSHPIISSASSADIPALEGIVAETQLFPSEMLADMIAPVLGGETAAFWLCARRDGETVGFCYVVPEEMAPGAWNMLALAVLPRLQGQGIGTALVAAAEARLRANAARLLIVDTSGIDAFARTRQFYAQAGYDQEARIRDYWAAGDDKITFRKRL